MTFVSDIDCGAGWDNELWAPPWHRSGGYTGAAKWQMFRVLHHFPIRGGPFKIWLQWWSLIKAWMASFNPWIQEFDILQHNIQWAPLKHGPTPLMESGSLYILLFLLSSLPPDKLAAYWHLLLTRMNIERYSNMCTGNIFLFRFGEFCVFVFLMFSFKNKHNIHKWDKNNNWQC